MEAFGIRSEWRQRIHGKVVRGIARPCQALPTAVDFKGVYVSHDIVSDKNERSQCSHKIGNRFTN
jgi:hypothetical protein